MENYFNSVEGMYANVLKVKKNDYMSSTSTYMYFDIHPAEPFNQLATNGHTRVISLKAEYLCTEFVFPEECSMQKKGSIDNIERNEKACDADAKIDYGNLVIYVDVCWNNINIHVCGGEGVEYKNIRLTVCNPSVLSV